MSFFAYENGCNHQTGPDLQLKERNGISKLSKPRVLAKNIGKTAFSEWIGKNVKGFVKII